MDPNCASVLLRPWWFGVKARHKPAPWNNPDAWYDDVWVESCLWSFISALRSPHEIPDEDRGIVAEHLNTGYIVAILDTPVGPVPFPEDLDPRKYLLPRVYFRPITVGHTPGTPEAIDLAEWVRLEYSVVGRIRHSCEEEFIRNSPLTTPVFIPALGLWDCRPHKPAFAGFPDSVY